MAQTSIKFDNDDIKEIRALAKENGLLIKRAIIVALNVGIKDKENFFKEYRDYGKS